MERERAEEQHKIIEKYWEDSDSEDEMKHHKKDKHHDQEWEHEEAKPKKEKKDKSDKKS